MLLSFDTISSTVEKRLTCLATCCHLLRTRNHLLAAFCQRFECFAVVCVCVRVFCCWRSVISRQMFTIHVVCQLSTWQMLTQSIFRDTILSMIMKLHIWKHPVKIWQTFVNHWQSVAMFLNMVQTLYICHHLNHLFLPIFADCLSIVKTLMHIDNNTLLRVLPDMLCQCLNFVSMVWQTFVNGWSTFVKVLCVCVYFVKLCQLLTVFW